MTHFPRFTLSLFLASVLPSVGALAQHSGDILLSVENGTIRTGLISDDGMVVTPDVRVFETSFGEIAPGFTDEPGFDNQPGTFPVPSGIGFRILRSLRVWSMNHFNTPAPPQVTIGISFGPLGPVVTPASDETTTGFVLAVGSNGEWHRHLEYTLSDPQATGIYLLELTLFSTSPEISESRPFWLVFGNEAPEPEVEAAVEWVVRNRICRADVNGDGSVTVQDIFDFLVAYFAGSTAADVNDSGGVTVQDVFDYLVLYFAGCGG